MTANYQYYICDVFTEERFAGNPLAVLPHAEGLSDLQMQQMAREFNFSESTFVLPPEAGHTRRVRIFTPTTELPFAGHPNVGTAFVLASIGELGALDGPKSIVFEEGAGPVPIEIEVADGKPTRCELEAPEALSLGDEVDPAIVAEIVSLTPNDFVTTTHSPRVASVGLGFLFAELCGLDALARVQIDAGALARHTALGPDLAIYLYVRGDDTSHRDELRARVLIAEGGYEDAATGSANCALAGLLAHLDPIQDGELRWRITQGVEMGRPSTLYTRAKKEAGRVVSAWVAGGCVLVASGTLNLDR
jgi:trans-2,3-dihydro-3-hydroxyanthranilate isomerase